MRHLTKVIYGSDSKVAGIATAFKLIEAAQATTASTSFHQSWGRLRLALDRRADVSFPHSTRKKKPPAFTRPCTAVCTTGVNT